MTRSTDVPDHRDGESGVRAAFVVAFIQDETEGRDHPLDHYLARFPGFAETIAREYLLLRQQSDSGQSRGVVGPYELRAEIGCGAQSIVFRALDLRLGRDVAVKVYHGAERGSGEMLMRFQREARIAARINHPNVCPILDAGTELGVPYIVMPLINGHTLESVIAGTMGDASGGRKRVLAETCLEAPGSNLLLFESLARGLHAVHEAGIIHRDIKPSNIMIDAEGHGILMDFGIARDETIKPLLRTLPGHIVGTPAYLAPELIQPGPISPDRTSDVWSLGVTLYESLTGRRPFDAPTREAMYQAILLREPLDLRKLNSDIPSDLCVVVETALEKDRDRRYPTAAAFAEDLEHVRKSEPTKARPPSAINRVWRQAVRHRTLVFAAILGVAVGASILLATRHGNEDLQDLWASYHRLDVAWVRGEPPAPEDEEVLRSVVGPELLQFMREHPGSQEAADRFMEKVKETRGVEDPRLIEPRATVAADRPVMRFRGSSQPPETIHYLVTIRRRDQDQTVTLPKIEIRGEDIAKDGTVTVPSGKIVDLTTSRAEPTRYAWNVKVLLRYRDEIDTLSGSFAVVTPGFRGQVLASIKPSGDAGLDRILRSYALLRHELASDTIRELEAMPDSADARTDRLRNYLLAWAHALLENRDEANRHYQAAFLESAAATREK